MEVGGTVPSAAFESLREVLERRRAPRAGDVTQVRKRLEEIAILPRMELSTEQVETDNGVAGTWVSGSGASGAGGIVLFLHGGGFVAGSVRTHLNLVGGLSEAAGLPFFVLQYRVAPEHPYPAAVEDVLMALEWLESTRPDAATSVVGDSAGGGLAIAAVARWIAAGRRPPARVAVMCPWLDYACAGESYRLLADADPTVDVEELRAMGRVYAGERGWDEVSGLTTSLVAFPELLVHTSNGDPLYSDAVALTRSATAAGVPVTFRSWPGLTHVWHVFWERIPESRDALHEVAAFVRQPFGPSKDGVAL